MPIYVVLSKLTDFGRKTIHINPDRILAVNRELERMGVVVKEQYALMGEYDFVNIVEAPGNENIFKMASELGSRGSVQLTPMPALPIEEYIKNNK